MSQPELPIKQEDVLAGKNWLVSSPARDPLSQGEANKIDSASDYLELPIDTKLLEKEPTTEETNTLPNIDAGNVTVRLLVAARIPSGHKKMVRAVMDGPVSEDLLLFT